MWQQKIGLMNKNGNPKRTEIRTETLDDGTSFNRWRIILNKNTQMGAESE